MAKKVQTTDEQLAALANHVSSEVARLSAELLQEGRVSEAGSVIRAWESFNYRVLQVLPRPQ